MPSFITRWRAVLRSGPWLLVVLCMALGSARAEELECESVDRYRLANGVEVVLQVDRTLPVVAVVSSVHAGSRNDPRGYEGLAHYVEHLLFREAGPFASVFSLYAGSGATLNATTKPDTTDYFTTLPSEQLERALWVEARRLALGLNVLDEAIAEQEKQVVLREQAMRRGYKPGLLAARAVNTALFGPEHPYHTLFATEESIEPLTLADARWFFASHYRPDRTRLIVVGDFEPTVARELVERYFGALSSPATPPAQGTLAAGSPDAECRFARQTVVPSHHRLIVSTLSLNERIEFSWPVPAGQDPEQLRPVIGLLTSQVAERAREQDVSHRVSNDLTRLELANVYVLRIDLMPGVDFEKAEPLVWEAQAQLGQTTYGANTRRVLERASDLVQRLNEPSLMDRALKLTRRACVQTVCGAPSEITPEQVAVFDKSKAVVLETRYGRNAPTDGSLEVLP
jgi:insulinase (Peptidase family M16)/peptidase M16-like protein